MSNEPNSKESSQDKQSVAFQVKWAVPLAWIFVGLGFVVGIVGMIATANDQNAFSLNNLASLGSFLQGSVASLWSLAGLLFIYAAFQAQRQQLQQQDKELERQEEQFKRQNFENTFFQLLTLHNEIVSGLRFEKRNQNTRVITEILEGRDCFSKWYEYLKQHTLTRSYKNAEVIIQEKPLVDNYMEFYKIYGSKVGHYFRTLYRVIKYVKDNDIADKRRYTSLVRAQLSEFEIVLLFFNCLSPYGVNFKPLVEEFALLEHLDKTLLFKPEDERLYDPKAFK